MGLHQAKIKKLKKKKTSAQLRKVSIKRLPTEWEEIYVSDKRLISKIGIECMQLNIKKPKNI